jgi:hypothetical protein
MKSMTKLLAKRHDLVRMLCLSKAEQNIRVFNTISSQSNAVGSSIIELLLASALALLAASTAAQMMNNFYNSGMNRRAAATSVIEVSISNDLAWFRQYAMLWRLQSGPFNNLSTQVTHTTAPYTQIPPANPFNLSNSYEVLPECGTTTTAIAIAFQNDAASLTTYVAPINSPPNAVPNDNSSTTIDLATTIASGYDLARVIQPGPTKGTLTITYTLSKSGTNLFERSNSIYLPAAGWCPP